MTFVVQMLADTPPYAFVLLAYLVWQGVRSLRPRHGLADADCPGPFYRLGLLVFSFRSVF